MKNYKNKYHEDYKKRKDEAYLKKFLEAISAAEKKQDKEDLDFLTSIIIGWKIS